MKGAWALAALALAGGAHGADDAASPGRWYVRIDNDVAVGTDRWYTGGERVARVRGAWEVAIVQEIYTPEAKFANPVDRSPTARLLASLAKHERGEAFFQTLEVDAGVRGPSALGRQTTNNVHHLVSAPFVDWSRQLADRFDGSLIFARTQSLRAIPVRIHAGAALGTQVTFAHMGIEARLGAPGAPSSALLRFAASPPFADGARGWSAYVGASIRAVSRNTLLTRGYNACEPDPTREPHVARVAVGLAWMWAAGAMTLDLVEDSREFTEQRKAHRFGSLGLHLAF